MWTAATVQPVTATLLDIAASAGTRVAVGTAPFAYRTLDGGETWAAASVPPSGINSLFGVITDGSVWLAAGVNSAFNAPRIFRSFDGGNSWLPATAHPTGGMAAYDVAAVGAGFVAVG